MIRGVLFDLDDLMIDSAPLHLEASRILFGRMGRDVGEIPEEMVRSFYGRRVRDIIEAMADFFKIDGLDIERLEQEQEDIFLNLIKRDFKPMPGLQHAVQLVEGLGLKRGVASSGTRRYVTFAVERLGLASFFETIVTGDMVKEGKPSPEIFLKAANMLGVQPDECVVLEDAPNGVRGAKLAKMRCIAVNKEADEMRKELSLADVIIKSLEEIDEKMLLGN